MRTSNSLLDRQMLEKRYQSARMNILLVVIFTAINILLLATQSNTYFLFSAYIPYVLVDLGMLFCGMYPAEFYAEYFPNITFAEKYVFVILLAVALLIVGVYLLSWILSKKNKMAWMIVALALFSLDTIGMLVFGGIQVERILDIVFHIWVIVSLAGGIYACVKLKKIPVEVIEVEAVEVETKGAPAEQDDDGQPSL